MDGESLHEDHNRKRCIRHERMACGDTCEYIVGGLGAGLLGGDCLRYGCVLSCTSSTPPLSYFSPGWAGVDKDPRTDSATSEIRPSRSRVDRSPGKSFAIPRSNRFRKTRLRGARYSRRDKRPGTNQDNTTTMLGHPAGNRSISPVDGPQHEPHHGCRPAPTLGRSRRLEASGEARSGGLHCREEGSPSHESTHRAQRECHGAQARQDRDKRPAMLSRSARLGRREDCVEQLASSAGFATIAKEASSLPLPWLRGGRP
jgi:hypothetical protein